MKKFLQLFQESVKEFSVTKNLVLCGLMAALGVVLGTIATINIGQYIRIGFSTVPNRIVDFALGPAVGAAFGGVLDILKYVTNPSGAFFPGFTISAILTGLIYGFILYKRPVSLPRVIAAEVLEKILVDCILNTIWLSILYKTPFWVVLITQGRLVTKLVQLPVDIFIVYVILKFVNEALVQLKFVPKYMKVEKQK